MKLPIFGLILLTLVGLAVADLTLNPGSFDYEGVQQGSTGTAMVTVTSIGISDAVEFTGSPFSYSNEFIGTYSFDGAESFDHNGFDLEDGETKDVTATITVPVGTMMGEYSATYTLEFNDGINESASSVYTQDVTATVLVTPLTGNVGDLEIVDTDSFDDVPNQVRVDSDLELEITVENNGNVDLSNVRLAMWIYDQTLKQVVAYTESSDQTINYGQDEVFDITLAVHQNLNEAHDYDIYAMTYQTSNMLTQYDTQSKDIDVLDAADLCDVGDLDINQFDLNQDEFTPGETVEVDVEVENKDADLEDVIVKVWLTERNNVDEKEKEKSDKFDLDEDETWDDIFELELDNDLDDGIYEVHVRVYESGNEDQQCYEEVKEIDVERPDNKVIIEDILISPSSLMCDQTFTAQVDVRNVGSKDDDAVKVRIINTELGIDVMSDTFTLDKYGRSADDETVYLTGAIPSDADAREYTLTFTLYYDDLDESKNYVEKITVTDCNGDTPNEEGEEDDVEQEVTPGTGNTVYLPTGFSISDFFNNDGSKTLFWVLGNIALLIVIVYFVTLIFRKKRLA